MVTATTEGIASLTTLAISGSGWVVWVFSEGKVQSGLVYSFELLGGGEVGGDEVGAQGKDKEHPLQPKIRLISANVIRMYPIFFSILPCDLLYHCYSCGKNFVSGFMGGVT